MLKSLTISYIYNNTASFYELRGTMDEITLAHKNIKEYLKNRDTFKIFKQIQKTNPILSPKEAWDTAEEIYELLVSKNVLINYE